MLALPLGILSGSVFNLLFLFWAFKTVFGWFPVKKSQKSILQIIFAGFLGGLASYAGLNIFSWILNLHTFWGVFLQGTISGIFGILTIAAIFYVLRNREFFEVVTSLKSAVFKTQVPAPEPEKLP